MKPRLLLHICCGPDEAWVVQTLRDRYELSCFFCNPNIDTPEEFELRRKVAEFAAGRYGVEFTSETYDPQSWEKAVEGVTDTPECGERCRRCFLLRLRRTALFGREHGFTSYTSVMSVSPYKRIGMLNETGAHAGAEYGLVYEPFDFKKKDGYRNSVLLSKELGLYRQDYCGCRLSKGERDKRKSARAVQK